MVVITGMERELWSLISGEEHKRKKRKKNRAFLNKRLALEKNMTNIADIFVNVKVSERRWIKRKSKRMGRKKILARTETSKINYGEP